MRGNHKRYIHRDEIEGRIEGDRGIEIDREKREYIQTPSSYIYKHTHNKSKYNKIR